uniref:Uncharacterized protein n=1 Tax=Timema poppense TaxID=170557 RepID=A0A7R9DPL3_TIMPO|nr:unnamed protein product [Timema poppensis]
MIVQQEEDWMYELYCADQQLECVPEDQRLIVKPTLHNGTHNYAHSNDDVNELGDSHHGKTCRHKSRVIVLVTIACCET